MSTKYNEYLFPEYKSTEANTLKLQYLNVRAGLNLTPKDLPGLRIVMDLSDFLSINKLEPEKSYSLDFISELSERYIGFFCKTQNAIMLRNVLSPETRYRYFQYRLNQNEKNQSPDIGYILPNKIDVMQPIHKLVLAEGPFDILSIYFNIEDRVGIYCSVNGHYYKRAIIYFSKLGIIYPHVKLYVDNDDNSDLNRYANILHSMRDLLKCGEILWNSYPGEKDFGVPPDKIIINKLVVFDNAI